MFLCTLLESEMFNLIFIQYLYSSDECEEALKALNRIFEYLDYIQLLNIDRLPSLYCLGYVKAFQLYFRLESILNKSKIHMTNLYELLVPFGVICTSRTCFMFAKLKNTFRQFTKNAQNELQRGKLNFFLTENSFSPRRRII